MAHLVFHGDCLAVMPKMAEASVGAIVTDPPYGLDFMGKDWDHGAPGLHFWVEALRVAKPGAHLVAFGGTRTYHRLTCAIEDAGWEIRDGLMWLYGSGFPKSLDVGKALDKAAGVDREVVGVHHRHGGGKEISGSMSGPLGTESELPLTAPATDAAKQWEGWGTALKPAWESIILAQKPLPESAERRIIVESLIHLEAQLWSLLPAKVAERDFGLSRQEHKEVCASAHWPVGERSNTRDVLSGLMGTSRFVPVLSSCLSIVSSWRGILAESYGRANTSTTRTATSPITDFTTLRSSVLVLTPLTIIQAAIRQPGSWWLVLPAARALNAVVASTANTLMPSVQEPATSKVAGKVLLPNWEPIILARKPLIGTVAENVLKHGCGGLHVDGCRIETTDNLNGGAYSGGKRVPVVGDTRDAKGAGMYGEDGRLQPGDFKQPKGRWPANVMLDEEAARILDGQSEGVARFFYCAKASKAERGQDNDHPTVKPMALMRWLCRLVTPPGGVVLDPFMGSGTTGVAAVREGFQFMGIELDARYCEIAQRRLDAALDVSKLRASR